MEWSKYILGILFIFAGIMHFVKPRFYLKIIPPFIPWHKTIVLFSGGLEVLAGALLLYPPTSSYGAILITTLLILFFPIHIYMLSGEKASLGVNKYILVLRFIGQFALIYWSYLFV